MRGCTGVGRFIINGIPKTHTDISRCQQEGEVEVTIWTNGVGQFEMKEDFLVEQKRGVEPVRCR